MVQIILMVPIKIYQIDKKLADNLQSHKFNFCVHMRILIDYKYIFISIY